MPGIPIRTTDSMLFPLPPRILWQLLADIDRYPYWWPKSLHVRAIPAPDGLIGSEVQVRPLGIRAFICRVVAVREPISIDLDYSGSLITGKAQWVLVPEGQGTRVSYVTDVILHGTMAAWLARCIDLKRVHSFSMARIFRGMRRQLVPG